jgi:hypothetical protein
MPTHYCSISVVLDIDFNKMLSCWAGHAGCEPAEITAHPLRVLSINQRL